MSATAPTAPRDRGLRARRRVGDPAWQLRPRSRSGVPAGVVFVHRLAGPGLVQLSGACVAPYVALGPSPRSNNQTLVISDGGWRSAAAHCPQASSWSRRLPVSTSARRTLRVCRAGPAVAARPVSPSSSGSRDHGQGAVYRPRSAAETKIRHCRNGDQARCRGRWDNSSDRTAVPRVGAAPRGRADEPAAPVVRAGPARGASCRWSSARRCRRPEPPRWRCGSNRAGRRLRPVPAPAWTAGFRPERRRRPRWPPRSPCARRVRCAGPASPSHCSARNTESATVVSQLLLSPERPVLLRPRACRAYALAAPAVFQAGDGTWVVLSGGGRLLEWCPPAR